VCFRVSDDVLSRCIRDVSEELLSINDDIVSHVYQAEFARVPEGTGLHVPPPPPGVLPPPHSHAATQYSDTMLAVEASRPGAFSGPEGSIRPMFPTFGTNAFAMPETSEKTGKKSSPVKETSGVFMKKSTVASSFEPETFAQPETSPVNREVFSAKPETSSAKPDPKPAKKSSPSLPSSPSPHSSPVRSPRSSLHRSSLHRSHDSTEPDYDEDFEDTATEASNTNLEEF
jgi:hypothetical protein